MKIAIIVAVAIVAVVAVLLWLRRSDPGAAELPAVDANPTVLRGMTNIAYAPPAGGPAPDMSAMRKGTTGAPDIARIVESFPSENATPVENLPIQAQIGIVSLTSLFGTPPAECIITVPPHDGRPAENFAGRYEGGRCVPVRRRDGSPIRLS